MKRSFKLVLLVGVAIALATAPGCRRPTESARIRDLFGERGVQVLAAPDRVEVFRVESELREHDPRRPTPANRETLSGFPRVERGHDQTAEFARTLGKILLEGKTYAWNRSTQCIFSPGVAFRIWKGRDSVLILLCFHCGELMVIKDGIERKGDYLCEFDPGWPELVKLAKQAFPNDAEIQKINDRRGG